MAVPATERRRPAAGPLGFLQDLYRTSSRYRLVAEVEVWLGPGFRAGESGRLSNGSIESSRDGDRYRIRAEVDPRLGLAPNLEVAFDGTYHQVLFLERSLLSYSRGDAPAPVPLPDPFLLPAHFLARDPARCPGCEFGWGTVRDASSWARRLARAVVAPGGEEIRIAGWRPDGTPVHYRLELDGPAEGWPLSRVTVGPRDDDERRLSVVEFDAVEPVPGSSLAFPRRVSLSDYGDDQERPVASVVFSIRELALGEEAVDAEGFSIPFDAADRVWDGDERRFVKTPGLP